MKNKLVLVALLGWVGPSMGDIPIPTAPTTLPAVPTTLPTAPTELPTVPTVNPTTPTVLPVPGGTAIRTLYTFSGFKPPIV